MTQDKRTQDILEAIRKFPADEKLFGLKTGPGFNAKDLHYLRDRLIEAMENYVDPLSIEKAEARCRELENQP